VEKTQEHPCAHLEGHIAVVIVVVALGVLLGLKKALPDLRQEGVPVPKHGLGRLGLGCAMLKWQ
jgi:hypothetical protein